MTTTQHRLLALALVLLLAGPFGAQQDAATLEVLYGEVEVRRVETEAWLPLAVGALTPTGDGDAVRTGPEGRTLLTFPEASGELLILPNSEVRLHTATAPGPSLSLETVRGEAVYRGDSPAASVVAGGTSAAVSAGDAHLLVSERDGLTIILVGEGVATLAGDAARPLTATAAVYTADDEQQIYTDLPQPTAPAAIVGRVQGCPGRIVTQNGQALNARVGPGTANVLLGQFPDGAQVQVMGFVASGGWVRVQFLSGFGWVTRIAVELDDDDCSPSTLPDDAFDLPTIIYDVTAREQALLLPFYGTPDDNPFFYQTLPPQ